MTTAVFVSVVFHRCTAWVVQRGRGSGMADPSDTLRSPSAGQGPRNLGSLGPEKMDILEAIYKKCKLM
jgi:hypothetical protein